MGIENWTPDEEEQLLREIADVSRANITYGNQVTPQHSDASAEILLAAPNADPGLVAALSDMVALTGMSVEDAQQTAVEAVEFSMQQELERASQNDSGGLFGMLGSIVDYSFNQTKRLTRTGLASLETLWQLGTSAYSRGEQAFAEQVMSDPSYELYKQQRADAGIIEPTVPAYDVKTLIATTDLGSLILNKGQGGEGFFTAGPAREMQERAAIAYRGGVTIPGETVDGMQLTPDRVVGYTPGRGLGFIAGQPGSTAYNTLSGAIDASWAIAAPTGFGQALKGARAASDAIDQSSRVRQLWRSKNGLTNHVTPYIRKNKVESWLNGTTGQETIERVVRMENISDARELLPMATVDVWDELVKADTPQRAREILLGELGTGTQDIRNLSIGRLNEVKQKILGSPFAQHLGLEKRLGRRPESGELIINGADNLAKTATIRNLEDYLKAMGIEPDVRNPIINRFARALTSDKGDLENVVVETRDLFIKVFESKGLSPEFLDGVFTTYLDTQKNSQLFNALEGIEGQGALYDLVYRDIAAIGPEGERGLRGRQTRATGVLDPEGRRRGIVLPDADRIFRAMSPFNWMFSRRGISQRTGKIINNPDLPARFKDQWGKPVLPLLGFKAIQNGIWKRIVLLQSSYAVRIALSGLLRQSFTPGLRTGIQHPVETILTAMFRKDYGLYRGTILGEPWSAADKLKHSEDMKEFIRQAAPRLVGEASKNSTFELAQFRAGAWAPAARQSDNYVQGVMDNIHLLSQDRLSRMLVNGISVEDIIQKAKNGDPETLSAFRDLQARLENTLELADGSKGTPEFFDEAGNLVEETAEFYLYDYFSRRIQAFTNGGDPRLIDIIRNGQDGGKFIDADGNEFNAFLSLDGTTPPDLFGNYSPEFQRVIEEIIEQKPDAFPELVKARMPSAVVDSSDLPQEIRDFVQRADEFLDFLFSEILARPDAYLNRSVVYRQNYWLSIEELLPQLDEAEAGKILENLREAYTFELNFEVQALRNAKRGPDGKFYVEGYKRPITEATRRKRLDAAEAKLDQRRQRGPSRKWMENYVGGKQRFEVILDHAEGRTPATGSRTLEEINALARVYAVDQLKKTLYDVSGETNIENTIRVASTFFGAWREGLTKSMKLIANNPQATKNFSVSYQALEDFDPDGDGRGFIYTHPQTGEQVFSYPANGLVGTVLSTLFGATLGLAARPYLGPYAVTAGAAGGFLQGRAMAEQQKRFTEAGIEVPLVTPVASLNMEIHASPGIGGILQIPLNAILNRNVIPHSDDIARALLPYGAPANAAVPASIRRIAEAINNDPDRDSELATLRTEVLAGLFMAGGYNRTNPSDMERLLKDSEDLAQVMLMLRGLNHFFGPGRPRAELKIPTRFKGKVTLDDLEYYVNNGSIESRMLSEIYGRMYAEDPETASIEFVAAFGDTSYGYLVGMTKATIPGIESSKEFYDWTIANKDVVNAYPNEYPWFVGNITNQYDNFVYRRQKETGERVGWESPMARLEAAEVLHASRMYRTLLRAAGPDPDADTLDQLRAYKIELQEQYPAYKQQTFEIGALESKIEKIVAASRGDLLADNSAAESVRLYAIARDEAIEAANARRVADGRRPATQAALSGNANADLRAVLRLYGESLAIYNPDFERVWSDVLFNEVDLEDS